MATPPGACHPCVSSRPEAARTARGADHLRDLAGRSARALILRARPGRPRRVRHHRPALRRRALRPAQAPARAPQGRMTSERRGGSIESDIEQKFEPVRKEPPCRAAPSSSNRPTRPRPSGSCSARATRWWPPSGTSGTCPRRSWASHSIATLRRPTFTPPTRRTWSPSSRPSRGATSPRTSSWPPTRTARVRPSAGTSPRRSA
ncbi:hypothetical protein D3C86_1407920 [compost metagenome]